MRYGISPVIAKSSVYCALNGHEGGLDFPSYKGLLDKKERERVSGEHLRIFHVAGGNKTLELKVGVHARTLSQKNEDNRKAIIAKGEIPWISEEIRDAYIFSHNPKYQFQEGQYKGKANLEKIRRRINEKYHDGKEVRTYDSVSSALDRLKKQRRKEAVKQLSQ